MTFYLSEAPCSCDDKRALCRQRRPDRRRATPCCWSRP